MGIRYIGISKNPAINEQQKDDIIDGKSISYVTTARSGGAGNIQNYYDFVYTSQTTTTLVVPGNANRMIFAGSGAGQNGRPAPNPGGPGGRSGDAQLLGYEIDAVSLRGQTLYLGIGGPTSQDRDTYVKTGSHSGSVIFELSSGDNAGSPAFVHTPGVAGGAGGSRFNDDAVAGSTGNNVGASGGGGGGYGDPSPFRAGAPGKAGGTYNSPLNAEYVLPWSPTSWNWNPTSPVSGEAGVDNSSYRGGRGGQGGGIRFNGGQYGYGGGGKGTTAIEEATPGGVGFLIIKVS